MTEPYRDSMHVDTLHSWAVDAQAELEQLRTIAKELERALIFSDAYMDAANKALATLLDQGSASPAMAQKFRREVIAPVLAKYAALK